jgi:LEM3 (ligand-effect modulator 3) family / CDC50 family
MAKDVNSKPNKPSNSNLKQQRLKGWRCSPSVLTLAYIYLGIFVFFSIFGIIILLVSSNVTEVTGRYDHLEPCRVNIQSPVNCTIIINIPTKMASPIFFYFEITNMYQNHRKYNKSRDIKQLMGTIRTKDQIHYNCDPVVDMEDLGLKNNLNLPANAPASPCGLIAKSYFNDTYVLISKQTSNQIEINPDDIAWTIDREEKFTRTDNSSKLQWTDVENRKD